MVITLRSLSSSSSLSTNSPSSLRALRANTPRPQTLRQRLQPRQRLISRLSINCGIQASIAQLQAQQQAAPTHWTADLPPDSPSILVAVASKGGGLVNRHFGHAREFLIYEVNARGAQFVGHRKIPQYCHGGSGEDNNLEQILDLIRDCRAVLVSKIGDCPMTRIREAGIEVVEDYDLIETVALKFYRTWLVNQTLDSKSPRS